VKTRKNEVVFQKIAIIFQDKFFVCQSFHFTYRISKFQTEFYLANLKQT